jgi:tetratricopeptide (TPR) repeat protein
VGLIGLAVAGFVGGVAASAAAQAPQQTPAEQKPAYTLVEYNLYQQAANEPNAGQRIKDLDDFVSKFPTSALLPYVYRTYYLAYNELKNYSKVIEYADREAALGEKVDAKTRFEALYLRTLAFNYWFTGTDPNAKDEATQARDAAKMGIAVLAQIPKPVDQTPDAWAKSLQGPTALFNYTAGLASLTLKDFTGAVTFFQAALAANSTDAVTYFRLGVAYLSMTPPQSMDGFWALARSVSLKGQGQAQVQKYLRSRLSDYQGGNVCDNLIDGELNELVTLAGTTADRPATYTIPSSADLDTARNDVNNFIPWLKEGGDHGKIMWLATCGSQYPDVAVRIMDIVPVDDNNLTLKVFRPLATDQEGMQKEMEAATEPNMEVHIVNQPDAKRLQKDDVVRFTGTLTGYTQNPFLLTWDTATVNKDDIPPVKPEPGTRRPPHKPTPKPPATK